MSKPSPYSDLPLFQGATFDPNVDEARLGTQLGKVRALMSDGKWRTLREIAQAVGGSESGCSARLRDMRKARFGSRTVNRRRRGNPEDGLFEYQLV